MPRRRAPRSREAARERFDEWLLVLAACSALIVLVLFVEDPTAFVVSALGLAAVYVLLERRRRRARRG